MRKAVKMTFWARHPGRELGGHYVHLLANEWQANHQGKAPSLKS